MLRFLSERFTKGALNRREWLRVGSLAGLGTLGLRRVQASSTGSSDGFGKAKSVILLIASGGQSQLETWDMKPDAPLEIRGDFRPIPTAAAGIRICEHMPHIAKVANLFTVVRSVNHEDRDHGSSLYLTLTGDYHQRRSGNPPLDLANDMPTYGAVLHRVRPGRVLPFTAAHVNGPLLIPQVVGPGQFAGRLGSSCEPLLIGDPTEKTDMAQAMNEQPDLSAVRVDARRTLLQSLDRHARRMEENRTLMKMDENYRNAYDLLSSRHGRQAFDIDQEPATLRERYGRYRSGQACLLARRLVEAGVPWITVMMNHCIRGQDKDGATTDTYGWDTHADIFGAMKDHLLPRFDQTFSALLSDLHHRGLLDSTLVVCMGEFGRHPLIGKEPNFRGETPGRRHWPSCYSIVMAGAGVRRGAVYGASDRTAAYPHSQPVGPWDVAATMFHALGVEESHYLDPSNRPFPVTVGKPITGVFG